MFERFTDRARRVLVLAREEAEVLNHDYLGTEHILLGLLREAEGVAAKALRSLGVSLEAVRQQVQEIVGRGESPPTGHIPVTPGARRSLELSLREARKLGRNEVGTEHILLGLIREGEGVGAQVLVRLGADRRRVRQMLDILSELGGEPPLAPVCPACGASLEGRLASKALPVGNGSERRLLVVYCTGCGVALQTRIEGPGP
jgi:ATP-dependent Clp protease ATP-binding subunit ClpC